MCLTLIQWGNLKGLHRAKIRREMHGGREQGGEGVATNGGKMRDWDTGMQLWDRVKQ